MSPKLKPMAVQYTGHVLSVYTIILSIISIKIAKCKIKNYNMIKLKILRLLWDIIVFRLVA